ncbi:MAG: fused signal transduction protein/response regulator [Hydrogenophilales bacterium CG03_land_8_20_14_0_80_62_28]|nr:chemotaxis protein CheV [Betaproteobacteria bacterium]OIO79307.1 MAG: fused signal transduction protein/response regulator [Hydrogenophilaceae bacterium CG1_02_62_390]PIV24555.1 MAG: fused signal transduction protein/response regulator [Hydrogenophilales bacterium CG03_land_8_20_14_0_80_62_28]PIW39027.1 MAG: fused signal transduction protein/response regulator [Hydrogenophilales bacterium CG15_BIG_FIL_POST_REV_8_21_14_020_62_31]PIW70770.1 MAG: fused signal transduction protein/response regul
MNPLEAPQLLDAIDARTKLAGSNKMELLLFSLGSHELFGINVFKVREVSPTPPITLTPNMPFGVEGVISLRGSIIPVISLVKFIKAETPQDILNGAMIVTEFSRHTQGFLVHDVDRIIRVDWDRVKPPENLLSGQDGLITAITELDDGRLVSILDVERILADVLGEKVMPTLPNAASGQNMTVFFADDSMVARKEIVMVLDKLGINYIQANNGLEAWTKLQGIATRSASEGKPVHDQIQLILVDAEMPEMDGYVLTRNIKTDSRLSAIPVVMHSSLSSEANRTMGQKVGVDAYVAKFDPAILADTLLALLKR